jgi:hypothetical protein
MLTEPEWARVQPTLQTAIQQVKRIREETGCSIGEAHERATREGALKLYEEITGFHETNVNAVFHHRLSIYGPPCEACGKPFRTPQARSCAACGTARDLESI